MTTRSRIAILLISSATMAGAGCVSDLALARFLHNPLGWSDGFLEAPCQSDFFRAHIPAPAQPLEVDQITRPRALDLYRPGSSVVVYEDQQHNRQSRVASATDDSGRWTVVVHAGDETGAIVRAVTLSRAPNFGVSVERYTEPSEHLDLFFDPPMRFAPVTMSLGPFSDLSGKATQMDGQGPSLITPVSVKQFVEVLSGDNGGWPGIKVVGPGEPWIVRTRLTIDAGPFPLVRTSTFTIDPDRGIVHIQETHGVARGAGETVTESHDWSIVEPDSSVRPAL